VKSCEVLFSLKVSRQVTSVKLLQVSATSACLRLGLINICFHYYKFKKI
jgi:hypothetical protein